MEIPDIYSFDAFWLSVWLDGAAQVSAPKEFDAV
jgi:hypothetical protein